MTVSEPSLYRWPRPAVRNLLDRLGREAPS
jgi:hypothetical protein